MREEGVCVTTNERLVDKAKEAFVMAIEIYNKPSINYRLEGFSFFICNAWELMLKAHMINKFGANSIYYSDKPNRTISLENCVQKIFTNEKAPLRKNLEKVIELRNTSTHFITEEYPRKRNRCHCRRFRRQNQRVGRYPADCRIQLCSRSEK